MENGVEALPSRQTMVGNSAGRSYRADRPATGTSGGAEDCNPERRPDSGALGEQKGRSRPTWGMLGGVQGPLPLWPPESGSQSGLLTGARELTVPMMISLYFLFLLFLTLGGQVLLPLSTRRQGGYWRGDL